MLVLGRLLQSMVVGLFIAVTGLTCTLFLALIAAFPTIFADELRIPAIILLSAFFSGSMIILAVSALELHLRLRKRCTNHNT